MPQHFAASLWWNASGDAPQFDRRASIAAMLFLLSLTDDPGLLLELADEFEDITPWRKA